MGKVRPVGEFRRRVVMTLVPWVIASTCVAWTIDGLAFRKPGGTVPEPTFGPSAPMPAPAPQAPAPKWQERSIDPSERVPV